MNPVSYATCRKEIIQYADSIKGSQKQLKMLTAEQRVLLLKILDNGFKAPLPSADMQKIEALKVKLKGINETPSSHKRKSNLFTAISRRHQNKQGRIGSQSLIDTLNQPKYLSILKNPPEVEKSRSSSEESPPDKPETPPIIEKPINPRNEKKPKPKPKPKPKHKHQHQHKPKAAETPAAPKLIKVSSSSSSESREPKFPRPAPPTQEDVLSHAKDPSLDMKQLPDAYRRDENFILNLMLLRNSTDIIVDCLIPNPDALVKQFHVQQAEREVALTPGLVFSFDDLPRELQADSKVIKAYQEAILILVASDPAIEIQKLSLTFTGDPSFVLRLMLATDSKATIVQCQLFEDTKTALINVFHQIKKLQDLKQPTPSFDDLDDLAKDLPETIKAYQDRVIHHTQNLPSYLLIAPEFIRQDKQFIIKLIKSTKSIVILQSSLLSEDDKNELRLLFPRQK